MIFKKALAAVLCAVLCLSLFACGGTDLSSSKEESRTVMTVDGFEVPYELYRYTVMMHLRDRADIILAEREDIQVAQDADNQALISTVLSALTDEEKEALRIAVKDDSVRAVVDIYSIFTAAKEVGLDPFGDNMDQLVNMQMEEIRATYADDEEYLSTLKGFFMTHNVYSLLTRYELVFDALYTEYVKNGTIDESDEAVIEHLKGENGIRAKQILISFERHDDAEALAIAREVQEKLSYHMSPDGTVDEAAFDALTLEYGEDLFMFSNTDGYYVCRGYLDEKFEEAAFALKVGQVSDIVRTSSGYSIILRASKNPTFIETKVESLSEGCLTGIYRTILLEYSENAVTVTDGLEDIDILNMK